jgi:death-on-curing protein
MNYLTARQVLFIHARVVRETRGSGGLRDLGALRSAVDRPRMSIGGEDLYPDVFTKAAALLESLVGNHPFVDGNKRTGIVTAAQFLWLNGHRLVTTNDELEDFVMAAARGRSDLATMAAWFREHATRR